MLDKKGSHEPPVDFDLPEGTKSLNLYKLHPPFRRLVNGHGYPGVLLERVSDGKIQCHLCGEWFKFLGSHVYQTHKISAKKYRQKFSLRSKDALCNSVMSGKQRDVAKGSKHLLSARTKRLGIKSIQQNMKTGKRAYAVRKGLNTLAYVNAIGLCPDQINYRFDVVAALAQRQPTLCDVRKYDHPVLDKILKSFGSFNKYIQYRGFLPRRQGATISPRQKLFSDVALVAAIRSVYLKRGRVKTLDFIGQPSYETIRRRFGGIENALREAGIDPATWMMVG